MQENTCARDSFFIKKESLTQVFFLKFCEISKNIFFNRTPPDNYFLNVAVVSILENPIITIANPPTLSFIKK